MKFSEWMEKTGAEQENFSNLLNDRIWDAFNPQQDDKQIFQKIAIPLFGPPKEATDDLGLSSEQKKLVNDIKEKCLKHSYSSTKICLATIFVHVYIDEKTQTCVPLLRVRSHNNDTLSAVSDNIYIDHLGRVYSNWAKYKDENTWDKAWLQVPKHGYYASELELVRLDQQKRGEVLQALDTVSTVTNVASSIGMLAGTVMMFIPPVAPIGAIVATVSSVGGAPGAAYGVGRSVGRLVDRGTHEQSISLADSEARQCWLTTAASLVSVGTLGSAKLLASSARAGNVASTTTRVVCTTLNVTAVTMSGLGILNSVYDLSQKDEVTPLDVFQLTTSIFFFTHSVVTFKTASAIIKDAQREHIGELRQNLSKKQQRIHDALLQASKENIEKGEVHEMHGNAKFIKEMSNIDNVKDFYRHFKIHKDGQLGVNKELTIHPRAFVQMTESERANVLTLSKQLHRKEIDVKQFQAQTKGFLKEYRVRLDQQRVDGVQYLKNKYGVNKLRDINIGGTKLKNIKPHEIDRLEQVTRNSFHNGDSDMMRVAEKMAQKQGASTVTEYCAAGEYAVRHIEKEIKSRMRNNPNPSRGPGIKAKDFYKAQVVKEFLEGGRIDAVSREFTDLRFNCDTANTGNPRFGDSMAAANHFDKHAFLPKVNQNNNLTPQQYFDIATEMAKGPISDVKWTQDGSSLCCTFKSEAYGAMVIKYDNLANGTSVIATLMRADNVEDSRLYNAEDLN